MFLPVVGVCSTLACDASDDETVGAQYLAWLKGRVVGDLVGLDTYRKVLADQGLPNQEIEQRIALISERSLRRPEAMRLWFNSMYGPEGAVGPDWPTPFVMDVVKGLKPGTALDVCLGEGRNSVFPCRYGMEGDRLRRFRCSSRECRRKGKESGSGDNSSSIRISGLQLRPREMGPDCDDVRLFPHPRHEICKPAH